MDKAIQNDSAVTKRATGTRGITIRLAESAEDIQVIIDLGKKAHAESGFAHLPYDGNKLQEKLGTALTDPQQYCLLLAERGSSSIGYIAGIANEYFFSSEICATAMVFYVDKDIRQGLGGGLAAVKLLHGFRRWAETRGARQILMSVTTGVDMARTDKLLQRMGFHRTGGNYALGLEQELGE